ncbi:hypothetical protein [Erythrobacter sp. 3-20A1M]|uniref:hypothetical protein n=1 Tax=Erythrobacter sp. 3-20A1M TaxID=2653850 RepID=UPI002040F606|nr:hypothetical protein [Erythrobacter sp. 3-20A1M]
MLKTTAVSLLAISLAGCATMSDSQMERADAGTSLASAEDTIGDPAPCPNSSTKCRSPTTASSSRTA